MNVTDPLFHFKKLRSCYMDLVFRLELFGHGDQACAQISDTNLVSIVVWPGEPFRDNCLV